MKQKKSAVSNSNRSVFVSPPGVPVWNFDTVTIDSELDSVRTEKVWQHIHSRPGERQELGAMTTIQKENEVVHIIKICLTSP